MADRARRKSSILKIPKQRAPLQEVNSLSQEIKSSQEEDVTSHTANLRRRVSFAGKNFVKEFCAEADIASVHHAVEYEQEWHASTDSSGLVNSDMSSNAHSNAGLSQIHGHSRYQNSASSVVIDDFIDPVYEIMREIHEPQSQVKQPKPVKKSRFSFGEIEVKNLDEENFSVSESQQKSLKVDFQSAYGVQISSAEINTQTNVPLPQCSAVAESGNFPVSQSQHKSLKVDFQSSCGIQISSAGISTQSNVPRHEMSIVNGSGNGDHECEVDDDYDGPYTQTDPSEQRVDDQPADVTQRMDESMELTKAVPGCIVLGFPYHGPGQSVDPQTDCVTSECASAAGELVGSCLSSHPREAELVGPQSLGRADNALELQEATEENIPENAQKIADCLSGRTKDLSRDLMSASMDFTNMLPENICVNVEDPNKNPEREFFLDKPSHSTTQVMSTSMEFTQVLPSNILCNVEENALSIGASERQNIKFDQTIAINTSMEFTMALPSNIQIDFSEQGNQIEGKDEGDLSHSTTQSRARCQTVQEDGSRTLASSMKFTMPEPGGNMVQDHNGDQNVVSDTTNEEIPNQNQTNVMCASMEFTRQMPSNIQGKCTGPTTIGLQDNINNIMPHNHTQALCTSMEFTRPLPSNIISNAAFNSDFRNNDGKEAMDVLENRDAEVQEPSKDDNQLLCIGAHTMKQSDSSQTQNTCTFDVERKAKEDGNEKSQSEVLDLHHENQDEISRGPESVERTDSQALPFNSSSDFVEGMSVSSISNPFKSKPRLISSPPTRSGIESIVPRGTVQDNALPISVSESSRAWDVVDIPDPFKSKPCIPNSPARSEQTDQHCQGVSAIGDVESTQKYEDTLLVKANGGLHLPSGEKHCMLLDVSPPFHDVSSNNSIEISANVTDSCTNLLHTTIKNAEITLRQMQEDAEEMSGPGKRLEDMDCDHDLAEDIVMSQGSETEGNSNHIQSSSPDDAKHCANGMEWETTPDSSRSAKRLRSSILDDEELTHENSPKYSKRQHDFDLEHKVCLIDSSNSPKRLCSSNSDLRKNNVCGTSETDIASDPQSVLSHSSLKDSSSKTNCSGLSIMDNSTHLCVDDILFEYQRRHPQFWNAVKVDNDVWSIKFRCTELELKVHLEPSQNLGNIVALKGCFTSNVTDKTKPAIRWGMSILMEKVRTQDWNSLVSNTTNFIAALQKIVQEVLLVRKFIIQIILLEKQHDLEFHNDSLSFDITSFKCHLWFQVSLKLDSWEKYSRKHISIKNIVGETRESEVKNLITGVKKDLYFLRNYITDLKDYVKTLEQFCK
ncbi:hypothetical protein ONE63_006598 [Megalurothrips usitatus]|uniref:Protein CASC5 n=1 Tax=Megalurothrips usitatus TaxID=439358 RepID=A0AAV7XTW2_9NEOP|nr:hypothetical protein ONE63_006598 [Megalurothrips usitatus]